MPYTTADARQQLLSTVAEAADSLAAAIASLSEAYELLDEGNADRVEEELFRPAQSAYGRAKRTYDEFAARHGLTTRAFAAGVPGAPSKGAKGFLEAAAQAVVSADHTLATLQDSMLPVEVGDAELRAGLEQVRELLGHFSSREHELLRTLGR
ncbi:MAG: hypothetical protein ACYDHN_12930 [Solirubrobacteraceae bacterium]